MSGPRLKLATLVLALLALAPLTLPSSAVHTDVNAAPAPPRVFKPPTLAVENIGTLPVRPDATIAVRVTDGWLTSIALAGAEGALEGARAHHSQSWSYRGGLRPGSTYTLDVHMVGGNGRQIVSTQTFRTVDAQALVTATVLPEDGAEVGIGQPITVEFDTPIENRAEVEQRLIVQASTPVEGAWHWMSPTEVRYRPRTYWPARTDVSVTTDLTGVDAGGGVWGAQDSTVRFHVGRAMRSVIDLEAFTMDVYEDGQLLRTIPITGGKSGFTTRSGTKVVLAKEYHKIMDALSIGIPPGSPEYYRLHVYYAVRVTSSGEFVHAAPWSAWAHGQANASHGCIGMSTTNGHWFYERTMVGDVIETTGTDKPMELSNGYGDWNLTWTEWLSGSALS